MAKADFVERQRRSNYRFYVYRTAQDTQPDFESEQYKKYPYPPERPSTWQGPGRFTSTLFRHEYGGVHASRAHPASQRARDNLRWRLQCRNLEWLQDLGRGGNGLASLFHVQGPGNRVEKARRRYYVTKFNHSGKDPVRTLYAEKLQTIVRYDLLL